jgi:hypothetical protein
MSENLTTELLMNCTLLVVEKFPWTTSINSTQISAYNRTELLDLLGDILTDEKQLQWSTQNYNVK